MAMFFMKMVATDEFLKRCLGKLRGNSCAESSLRKLRKQSLQNEVGATGRFIK